MWKFQQWGYPKLGGYKLQPMDKSLFTGPQTKNGFYIFRGSRKKKMRQRPYVTHNAKIFIIWSFKEKVCWPFPKQK